MLLFKIDKSQVGVLGPSFVQMWTFDTIFIDSSNLVVNHCFTSLFGTTGLLDDFVIR